MTVPDSPHMGDKLPMFSREAFLERLDLKLAQRGLSERAVCLRAGLSAGFLKSVRHQGSDPGIENVTKVADVLQCRVAWLIGEDDVDSATPQAQRPERIRIVGEVRASTFRTAFEMPESEDPEDDEVVWLPPDPRYPGVPRFALKVSGPSVNVIAADGATIVCARFLDLERYGRMPMHGDLVVVQRWHHDLVEATCKAFIVRKDGVWLEPRTTMTDIEPIHVIDAEGQKMDTADEVLIHALVRQVVTDLD